MTEQTSPTVANDRALQLEVAQLIVEALNLDIKAADIAPEAPLYGDGLGLDSIDVLEISLVISKRYGLQLRADDQDNQSFFSSLSSLSTYIASKRTL
jgi:acyl carrier protein